MARIIVADDDEVLAEVICSALIEAGHIAGFLTNGRDALRTIKARRPDLAILDCNMPELSGVMLLRELRKSPELCTLPVLMLTGRRNEQDVQIAYFAGCDDYLKKPCHPDEVVFRVHELLAKKATVRISRPSPRKLFGRRAA